MIKHKKDKKKRLELIQCMIALIICIAYTLVPILDLFGVINLSNYTLDISLLLLVISTIIMAHKNKKD